MQINVNLINCCIKCASDSHMWPHLHQFVLSGSFLKKEWKANYKNFFAILNEFRARINYRLIISYEKSDALSSCFLFVLIQIIYNQGCKNILCFAEYAHICDIFYVWHMKFCHTFYMFTHIFLRYVKHIFCQT